MGLTGYYRRFIQGYAKIAAPLTDLLRTNSFHWSDAATTAFLQLKRAMLDAPVLRLPNFSTIFIVETDASNVGVGALLIQDEQPLAYFSKKIGPRMHSNQHTIGSCMPLSKLYISGVNISLGDFLLSIRITRVWGIGSTVCSHPGSTNLCSKIIRVFFLD